MAYTYEQVFAADPSNPSNVAQNASVTIFAPGDATMTPLAITDPDGQPLANPIPTNANGFGSAFAHETLDRVAWAGGGFTGYFTSYEGMKQVATAAQTSAEASASEASTAATSAAAAELAAEEAAANAAATVTAALAEALADVEAAANAAAESAALVGAPADSAVAAAVSNDASATNAALLSEIATAPTVVNKVAKGELIINAKDYGATGDGTTDDTAAIHAALAAGREVHLPAGTYRTATGIVVPEGKALYGTHSRSYTGASAGGAIIKAMTATQTGAVVTLVRLTKMQGISVSGVGPSPQHNGVLLQSGQSILTDCAIYDCAKGIDGNYSSGNVVHRNQIHYNQSDGIFNVLDTIVTHNTLNSNKGHGINLQIGAGDNSIGFNKIEWNDGRGISMQGAPHCNIVSNIIDRNGLTGIRVLDTTQGSCGPNVIRRNGRLAVGIEVDDCNIYTQSNSNYTFIGNTTESGGNDGGGGYISPLNSVVSETGTDVSHIGNNYSGGTALGFKEKTAGTRTMFSGNKGIVGPQLLASTAAKIGEKSQGGVAASGTTVEVFKTYALGTFAQGRIYQLSVAARASTGSKYAALLLFQVSRESGSAAVSTAVVTPIVGTTQIGPAGTVITVGLATNTDGSEVTVTLTNVSANSMGWTMSLTSP